MSFRCEWKIKRKMGKEKETTNVCVLVAFSERENYRKGKIHLILQQNYQFQGNCVYLK